MESKEEKLAKLHGSMPFEELRAAFSGPELCGVLAHLAGVHPTGDPVTPDELIERFDWQKVRTGDVLFAG